jgi:hypothetical protein
MTRINLGLLLVQIGQAKEGWINLEKVIALHREAVREAPQVPEYRLGLARSDGALAISLALGAKKTKPATPQKNRSNSCRNWSKIILNWLRRNGSSNLPRLYTGAWAGNDTTVSSKEPIERCCAETRPLWATLRPMPVCV